MKRILEKTLERLDKSNKTIVPLFLPFSALFIFLLIVMFQGLSIPRNTLDQIMLIFFFTTFLVLFILSPIFLYQGLPVCDKLIGNVLTIKKRNLIINGKLQTNYYIAVKKGIKAVKISIDSIQFYKPEYRNLSMIKDLRAVIYVNDSLKIEPDKIEFSTSHVCLEFYETVDLGSQEPKDKAKVVLFSGRTPIGHTFIKTEVE